MLPHGDGKAVMTMLLQTMSHITFQRLRPAIAGVLVLVLACTSPAVRTPVVPTPSPTEGIRYLTFSGDEGFVSVEDPDVIAATTKANYIAFENALFAKDRIGINNLFLRGALELIDNGTRVLCLDVDMSIESIQVRVLEGKHLGRSFWIPHGSARKR